MDNNTETATANDGKQTSATAAGPGALSLSCCFYIDKTEYGTYRHCQIGCDSAFINICRKIL